MKSGLYAFAGASATATAAAWAKRLDCPMTKLSNVYFGFSRVSLREEKDAGGSATGCSRVAGDRSSLHGQRRRHVVAGELRIDHDTERAGRRVHVDPGEGLHDRGPHALVDLRRGEVVRHVEVEGAAHHALRHGEVQEPLHLRADAVVAVEVTEHGRPDRNIWNLVLRHGPPGCCAPTTGNGSITRACG